MNADPIDEPPDDCPDCGGEVASEVDVKDDSRSWPVTFVCLGGCGWEREWTQELSA